MPLERWPAHVPLALLVTDSWAQGGDGKGAPCHAHCCAGHASSVLTSPLHSHCQGPAPPVSALIVCGHLDFHLKDYLLIS